MDAHNVNIKNQNQNKQSKTNHFSISVQSASTGNGDFNEPKKSLIWRGVGEFIQTLEDERFLFAKYL